MFSIIIPLYNKAQYILRALKSIKLQTFKEYEVLVIDDGSSDEGPQLVLQNFADAVTLIRQANEGVSSARNAGIALAKYDFIVFLDADDYWHPNYLERMSQAILTHPKAGIFGSSYGFKPEDLRDTGSGFTQVEEYFEKAIHNTLFFTSATVIKKSFFDQGSWFNTTLKRGEDLDVWFRAILHFGNPVYSKDRLVYYEKGDNESATKRSYSISQALVSRILNPDYVDLNRLHSSELKRSFDVFKVKYVLFNIFPYFRRPENHILIKKILSGIKSRYTMVNSFYALPSKLISQILEIPFVQDQFRNYLKFCFRYVYN
jgi:glycosyltransferase involved in cell wall biosynthesis